MNDSPTKQEPITKKIDKSIHSEDEPLGKQAPGAPFALVGLTYLIVLFVAVAAILIGIWASQ
jgi:hypothetical protein